MIAFASSEFQSGLAALRASTLLFSPGRFRTGRFANGELFIEIETPVKDEDCLILGSVSPPDTQLFSTLLLAHTLRKEGAKQITGVFPYLAYSRQDKNKPRQSLAAAWTGAMLRASGFDKVITLDVHSPEDEQLFPIPLISISTAGIFAAALNRYQLTGATIVAPDKGAIARCEAVRAATGLPPLVVPWFEKHRLETGIFHSRLVGEVGSRAVLIDDILDTGATLVSACEKLLREGVEDIQIMVTHGLFTGRQWESLWELGVSRIFCTDTIPFLAGVEEDRILVLLSSPLLASELPKLVVPRTTAAGPAAS